jgi:energy-coupling factor transporter ATP-binding protein EcfA2
MVPYDPEHITYFAETDARGQRLKFGIKSRDRTRHMYVIGKSGVGKSTLLENMAIQDIAHGEGVAVLDPHGSFAEKMLEYIPQERIKDVVYFAPFDTDNPISFNVLEDVGHDKRHLVASGLMSSFKKIWVDAWSARMEYILNNILLALLEYPDATLLGVNRMLSDKVYRNKVVENLTDPSVKSFWTDEFAKYGERYMQEAGAAIQNKIGQFTANPLVRNIIGQPKSTFDIRKIMDEQKILIINLSKGRIGEQNTSLLGSMIITKIYLGAMSRAELSSSRMGGLANFYFYVDEFQSFANETFADILAEARKYRLALIIAHQYVAQMEEKVRDAVFGNVGTTISFRVGPLDAELLEKVFAPQFSANDIINLGMAEIYLTLMINDIGSQPFSAKTLPPLQRPAITFRNDAIEWSRSAYAHPKEEVEKNIRDWYADGQDELKALEEQAKNKKKITFADGTAPQPYTPRPKFAPVSVGAPAQGFVKKQFTPKQAPDTHKPFTKAFAKPTTQTGVIKETQQVTHTHEVTVKASPELKGLLDAIDGTATPVEVVTPEQKPSREPTLPVKHAERGPTEKNRDLLKAALQQAMKDAPMPTSSPVSAPPTADRVTENLTSNQVSPNTAEVSPDDLRKVLE